MNLRALFLSIVLLAPFPAQAQQPVIAPNENLTAEGIPPVPVSIAEEVGRYSEFRSAVVESWHPTRREMLIRTRFADTYQIHLVKSPGGARTQLTFFKDRVVSASYQPTQGNYMVLSADVGGAEFFQLYRYDLDTGRATLLTDGKSRNLPGRWSNAGNRYVYGSTRRTGDDVDLYVIDPAAPGGDHILSQLSGGGWQPLDWSPDDRKILALEEISVNETYLWLFDAATGEKTPLTPKGGKEKIAYDHAVFSKDGKGIYLTTDRDSEFLRLAYLDLASRQYTFITDAIHWDVEGFALSYDGKALAFSTNEDGASVLHFADTATRQILPVLKIERGVITGLRWNRNGQDLAFNLNSSHSTTDVFSLDVKTGVIQRWTSSETGGLNTSTFAEPELVHWKSFDGLSISGYLYRPPQRFTGKHPVVIYIHGGPEGQSRPDFQGQWNYLLNEMGVALIRPNVRGSTGYGKTFVALDNGFLREGSYKDIGALLDWIKTQPDLDAERIMIIGGSYGGHMTLAVATFYSDRIRCAVDIVGIANLVSFLEHTSGYRRDLRRVEYGDERDPKMRAFLEKIAPINNADKIRKPLFVIHGKNDPRVPVSEAEHIVSVLRKNGTPVWFLLARNEGHGFQKKQNQEFQFYSTILFMKEFLLK